MPLPIAGMILHRDRIGGDGEIGIVQPRQWTAAPIDAATDRPDYFRQAFEVYQLDRRAASGHCLSIQFFYVRQRATKFNKIQIRWVWVSALKKKFLVREF